ncbi:aldehyde dehydrogenase family protein [Paracoccus seriniphilus]|uniref:Succinate-semialdehyde dehydrogenase / glutarate-semialdehyde dehydrogenase n=1 Tax=Paracoccus seriniphilus TaxID=184748 RepID=A0A239Q181_9RHOB|nr:aldehyde dehydrogenase family protein [Paracoccus seriniphilus]WCR16137.1 aldehyde dehydrogenase family protein [Paracoccus seriniphilus]SNT76245.1 succinate-semialdehyde dehydrogenase / glutarate-semialdehyde dehydrogenase [Paracoccus seriniphilus]
MKFPTRMYLCGELREAATTLPVENPATEQHVVTVATAAGDEVRQALNCARDAFPTWSRTSIAERQAWMRKLRAEVIANEDYLRLCIHQEMGKSWASTQEDFDSLKNSLAFYAEEIARLHDYGLADRPGTHCHRMVHEPAGVAVAFLAWNFPLLNLAFKIGPAMAAGCPIIIRPSNDTPISAYAVGELCHRIGLPKGVVQIIATASHEDADMLSASTIPAVLTLIGSTETGRHIMRTGSTSIKKYSMELGGNAPALVFDDADVDQAVATLCGVKFSNAGQICVSPNRVFVHRRVLDSFTAKAVAHAKGATVGWDREADITTGPLINRKAFLRNKTLVDDAVEKGARLLAGGDRPASLSRGHYLAPTVLADVDDRMKVYRQESFGPIISIIPFDDDTPLAEMANDGEEGGLTAYVFTRDLARAEHYASLLRYGEIQINGVKYDIDLPHGGIGQSGIGHDCSALALHDYLVLKRVTRALPSVSASGDMA